MIDVRDISVTYNPAKEEAGVPVCTASFGWKSAALFRYVFNRIHHDEQKNDKVQIKAQKSKEGLPQLVLWQHDPAYDYDMRVVLTFYRGLSLEQLSHLRASL